MEKPLRNPNHFWPCLVPETQPKALGQIDKEELEGGKKATGTSASQRQCNQRAFDENSPHMEDLAILHRGNKARALQRNEWNRRCQTRIRLSFASKLPIPLFPPTFFVNLWRLWSCRRDGEVALVAWTAGDRCQICRPYHAL